MKRFLLILLALAASAWAQQQQPSQARKPDCLLYFTLTQSTLNSAFISNATVGCYTWSVSYISNGFSGETVTVQSAPDASGVPGTWTTFVGGAGSPTVGTNPMTAITYSSVQLLGYNPWVRVNLSGLTGTGTVQGIISGFLPGASSSGGGGGGGSSPNAHVTFTNAASVNATVTGASANAIVMCWDTTVSPSRVFLPDHVTVPDANTVAIFFVPNATGYCNVSTGSGVAGPTGTTGATGPPGSGNNAFCQDATGSTTAYTCPTPSPTVSTLSGLLIAFIPQTTNTTITPTVNVSALGAKTLVASDGTALAIGALIGGTLNLFSYDGTNFRQGAAPVVTDGAWINVSGGVGFKNSWTDCGAGHDPTGYEKDRTNRVWLRGCANPGTITSGTPTFTLPVGFRPLVGAQDFIAPIYNGGSNFQWCWVSVQTNGDVQFIQGGQTALGAIGGTANLSLAGLSFSLN